MSAARPARLYRSVIDHLLERMATEQLQPGHPLPTERGLAESFGVSRNVVREGFRVLEERGLIVTRQGAGRYVRELPSSAPEASSSELDRLEKASIADVLEARLVIEQEVAALACQRRTTSEAEELHRLARQTRSTWARNVEFHVAIARLTHNFALERVVREQMEVLGELRQRAHYPPEVAELLGEQHLALADAILDRDERRARELVREHLATTRRSVAAEPEPR